VGFFIVSPKVEGEWPPNATAQFGCGLGFDVHESLIAAATLAAITSAHAELEVAASLKLHGVLGQGWMHLRPLRQRQFGVPLHLTR